MSTSYKVRVAPVPKGAFSTTAAYKKNDIVRYGTASYIFTADKTAGAWYAAIVQLVCQDGIGAEIMDGGNSAGI